MYSFQMYGRLRRPQQPYYKFLEDAICVLRESRIRIDHWSSRCLIKQMWDDMSEAQKQRRQTEYELQMEQWKKQQASKPASKKKESRRTKSPSKEVPPERVMGGRSKSKQPHQRALHPGFRIKNQKGRPARASGLSDHPGYQESNSEVMREPVFIPRCGHTFEKQEITRYLRRNPVCPLCNKKTERTQVEDLVPNYQLKGVIEYCRKALKPRE